MATYVSKRQRARRLIIAVATGSAIAATGGYVVGRSSVPTVTERVSDAKSSADTLATRVSALTIEYEQATTGQGDSVEAGVTVPLAGISADLDALLEKAEWVSPTEAARAERLIKAVGTAASAKVDVATFEQVTSTAAQALRDL